MPENEATGPTSTETVEVTRHDDGRYTAVDTESGVEASGLTKGAAAALALPLMDAVDAPELSESFRRKAERGRRQIEDGEYVALDDLRWRSASPSTPARTSSRSRPTRANA